MPRPSPPPTPAPPQPRARLLPPPGDRGGERGASSRLASGEAGAGSVKADTSLPRPQETCLLPGSHPPESKLSGCGLYPCPVTWI